MANQRSPNCPQISFQEAADKGRVIYGKEYTHPAAKEVVAQSLGYSGINGRSLSMIGALRQYGILEGNGDALRISDDAVAFFVLEDGLERSEALMRMIFHPPMFAQIHADFGDSLPSESNLTHYLMKNGFLPKAAKDVIDVYRENIRLVETMPKRYTKALEMGAETMSAITSLTVPKMTLNEQHTLTQQPVISLPTWSQSFTLTKDCKAELIIRGDVTKEGLARLKTYIGLTISALAEESYSGEADPQDGSTMN